MTFPTEEERSLSNGEEETLKPLEVAITEIQRSLEKERDCVSKVSASKVKCHVARYKMIITPIIVQNTSKTLKFRDFVFLTLYYCFVPLNDTIVT